MSSFDAGQNLGEIKMNKTIMALAFVVLCSGFVFAAVNPAVVNEINNSKWTNTASGTSVVLEGGNVSATDLGVNTSTEKWAGAFGDISGRLILAQNADINFLYNWTFAHPDKGEVCVTTNPAAIWTSLAALTAIGQVDSAYGFDTGATDSATNTMTTTSPFDIGSSSGLVLNALIDNAGWETGVVGLNGAGSNIPNDLAFCVNISPGATNYKGSTSDYEIIMPANETVGTTQTYYFYTELV